MSMTINVTVDYNQVDRKIEYVSELSKVNEKTLEKAMKNIQEYINRTCIKKIPYKSTEGEI